MPNWCATKISIRHGDKEKLKALHDKINEWTSENFIDNDFGLNWLGNVVGHSGIARCVNECFFAENGEEVECRGEITLMNLYDDELFICTVTAWYPMIEMWHLVCDKYLPGAEILFSECEGNEEEDCEEEEENEGEYGDEDEDEEKEEEEEGDEEVDEDALLAEVSLEGAAKFTLDQGVVKNMLRLTSYAASTKRQPRPVLNSVLFRFKGGRLSVVATDSCRLAIVERELASPGIGEADLIVPLKTVKKLLETLGDDGEVHISATTTHTAFEYGSHNVTAKLAEGDYPDFRKIIPEASGNGVTLGREPFLSALCRVSPPMDGDSDGDNLSGVVVDLFLTPNRLEILSTDSGGGKIRERMDVEYSGPDASAAFHSGYLTDALDHLATDEIDLDIGNGTSPGIIRAAGGFLYVFAAVRVR